MYLVSNLADAEARLQLEAGEGEEGEDGRGGAGADGAGRHDCLFVEPTLARVRRRRSQAWKEFA